MKRFIFYLIVYAVFVVLFGIIAVVDNTQREKDYLSQKLKEEISYYRTTFSMFDILSEFFIYKIATDNTVKKSLANTNKENLDTVSKKIYNIYKTDYLFLRKYGVEKAYIYLPDGTVVLRFHNPERFGDILNVKNDIAIKYFSQILAGKKLVGNIKVLIPFEYARNILKRSFPNKEYLFLVNNKYLTFKEFKGYLQTELHPDFYYTFTKNILPFVSKVNIQLSEKLDGFLERYTTFNTAIKENGKWYIVSFVPIALIFNNLPKDLGYLVSYQEDNYISVIRKNFWEVFLLGNGLFAGILLFMFYRFKDKEKFEELASTDPLTKVLNRRKFDEMAQFEFDKAKRYKRPLSFIIIDIDDFKKINDKYGHQVGDKVLIAVADEIKKNIRKTDIFARFGGEEFVILAPETDIAGAKRLAEKLRKIIENMSVEPVKRITASFGATEVKESDKSIDDLYRRADKALYDAKDSGKNIVRVLI